MQHNVNDNIKAIRNREDCLKMFWGMEGLHYNEVFCRLYKAFFFFQQHLEGYFFSPKFLDTLSMLPFWYWNLPGIYKCDLFLVFFFPFLTRVNLSTAKH